MRNLVLIALLSIFAPCAISQPLPISPYAAAAAPQGRPEVKRIRGTVVRFSGTILTILERNGKTVDLITESTIGIQDVYPIGFSSIISGSVVGTTGVLQSDGHLRAIEVRLFPPGKGGPPQGHRSSNLSEGAVLFNGSVLSVDTMPHKRQIVLTMNNIEQIVDVPDDAPITTYEPATLSDIKPGVKVYLHAIDTPTGLKTVSVTYGKDGLTPPM